MMSTVLDLILLACIVTLLAAMLYFHPGDF
jgi:hypothetical protein